MDGWTVPGKFYIQRSPQPLSLSRSETTNDWVNGVSSTRQANAMKGEGLGLGRENERKMEKGLATTVAVEGRQEEAASVSSIHRLLWLLTTPPCCLLGIFKLRQRAVKGQGPKNLL